MKKLIEHPNDYGFIFMVKKATSQEEIEAFISSFNLCKKHARIAGDMYIAEHQDLVTVITKKEEYYIIDFKKKIIGRYTL
ncbi:MAG: hypothetical protein JZD40_01015 [Sulfolobus sp.]|nr:hypothetical protein [Sulfolobus sp.]